MAGSNAPIFDGVPSPSLKKMRRMTDQELILHAEKLEAHAAVIREKLERKLAQPNPGSSLKNRNAQRQHDRLQSLAELARSILKERQQTPSAGYSRGNV